MPGFYSPTHISHVTGLFGVNKAKKVQKTRFLRKYDVITPWRSYVTIFFSYRNMPAYYIYISWKFEGNRRENKPLRADLRGDFVASTVKIANVFLSYNSGTASPILDPKVALERQFG